MNAILRHSLKLILFTSGVAFLLFGLQKATKTELIHTQYPGLLLFMFLLSLASSAFVLYGVRNHRRHFNAFFFPAMIFRFFASIIYIVVMVLTNTPHILYFVLDFFVLYLLFQVFEITSLMTNLRSHLENRGNEDN
jgi:hypothetical protein